MSNVYINTGKGRSTLKYFYDCVSFSDLRKEPITKNEFISVGLTDADFDKYISLIKALYGECFIYSNSLALKYDSFPYNSSGVWNELYEFCINHDLIIEYATEQKVRFVPELPSDLLHFRFIYSYPECPPLYHVCNLDEFRYTVELFLAGKNTYEYYVLRYQPDLFDFDDIIQHIDDDLDMIEYKISELNSNVPSNPDSVFTPKEFFKLYHEREKWIEKRMALEIEQGILNECYNIAYEEAGEDLYDEEEEEEIQTDDTLCCEDDTLYVHKGKIICQKNHHNIEQATAVLMDVNGNDIELNVSHCLECNKFFIDYTVYQHYREKYGIILGNIRMAKNGGFHDFEYELSDESPLHLCGYSVSQKAGLSQAERQTIIESCIKSGAMDKENIIHLLKWLIEVNGAKKGNEWAYKKWCSDMDFALAYNTSRQNHYKITKIEQYKRNRFYTNNYLKNKTVKTTNISAERSYIGKKVKHSLKKFGEGIIVSEDEYTVSISFNGSNPIKFDKKFFNNGMLTLVDN